MLNNFEKWMFNHPRCGGEIHSIPSSFKDKNAMEDLSKGMPLPSTWQCTKCLKSFKQPPIPWHKKLMGVIYGLWFFWIIFPLSYIYWSYKERRNTLK